MTVSNLLAQVARAYGKIRKYQAWVSFFLLLNFPLSFIVLKLGGSPESTMYVYLGISIVLSAIIFFNSTYFMDYPINCRKETITIKENLAKVSEISKSQRVNIKFFTYAYYGLEFNFRDYGINYKIVGRTTGELIPVYGKMAEMEVVYNEENLLNN